MDWRPNLAILQGVQPIFLSLELLLPKGARKRGLGQPNIVRKIFVLKIFPHLLPSLGACPWVDMFYTWWGWGPKLMYAKIIVGLRIT